MPETLIATPDEIRFMLDEINAERMTADQAVGLIAHLHGLTVDPDYVTEAAEAHRAIKADDYADSEPLAEEGGWSTRAAAHEAFLSDCHDRVDSLLRITCPPALQTG